VTPLKPYLVRALHEWILDNGYTPYILVDTTIDGVTVPKDYISDNKIILNTHPDAIQNWYLENDALSFSARFSGKEENLFVPINAVLATYAKENGKGMMFDEHFEDDLPPDPPDVITPTKNKRPALKVVK
jgi:stringent starvation protein B